MEILEVHKTIKYKIFEIITDNGLKLCAAEKHIVIDENYNEIYLKDCLGATLITEFGPSKVISLKYIKFDNCYDFTLKDYPLYYSNGI